MASKGMMSCEAVNKKLVRDQEIQKSRSQTRKMQQAKKGKAIEKVATAMEMKAEKVMPAWLAVREASARKDRANWNQAKRLEQQKQAMNPLTQALKGLGGKVQLAPRSTKTEFTHITRELETLWLK